MKMIFLGAIFLVSLLGCKQSSEAPTPINEPLKLNNIVGCSKDTDCKGDRICESGVCSAPEINSVSEISEEESSRASAANKALEDQLSCRKNPEPAKAILAMIDNGLLSAPTGWEDGVPTLTPTRDMQVFGRRVLNVSGFEDNSPKGRAADLFPRGPGTSPGYFISVVLDAKPAEVDYVARPQIDGDYESPYSTIGEPYDSPGKAVITCSGRGA